MFGIGKASDKLVAKARHTDPKTSISVLQAVYEPLRKDAFSKTRVLMVATRAFEHELRRRAFFIEDHEIHDLFEQ
jgi:hypothetical protein